MREAGEKGVNEGKDDMSENINLTELITVTDQVKAEMIKNILKKKGIECMFQKRVASSVHPFTVDGLAETKILVDNKNLAPAREMLKGYGFS